MPEGAAFSFDKQMPILSPTSIKKGKMTDMAHGAVAPLNSARAGPLPKFSTRTLGSVAQGE